MAGVVAESGGDEAANHRASAKQDQTERKIKSEEGRSLVRE